MDVEIVEANGMKVGQLAQDKSGRLLYIHSQNGTGFRAIDVHAFLHFMSCRWLPSIEVSVSDNPELSPFKVTPELQQEISSVMGPEFNSQIKQVIDINEHFAKLMSELDT